VCIVRSVCVRRKIQHRLVWQADLPLTQRDTNDLKCLLTAVEKEQAVFISILPVSDSICRWLTTPFPSIRKARQVFPSLLDIQLPFKLEQCRYRFIDVQQKAGQVKALAVAARDEQIENHIEQCQSLQIDPVVIVHEGLALWNLSRSEVPPKTDEQRIVTWIGKDHSILLFGKGKSFTCAENISIGTASLSADDESSSDAWGQRVSLIMHAHASDIGPEIIWYWCGPGAVNEELITSLQNQCVTHNVVTYRTHKEPEHFAGKAANTLLLSRSPLFSNFRDGPFSHTLTKRMNERVHTTARLLTTLLGILLILVNVAWLILLHRSDIRIDAELHQRVKQLTHGGSAPKAQEVLTVNRILDAQRPAWREFARMLEQRPARQLANLVKECSDRHIHISQLSITPNDMLIRGDADHWNAGGELEIIMQQTGYKTSLTRKDAGADERVHFQLKGVIHEP